MSVTAFPTTKTTRKHVVLLLCNGACSINQIKKRHTQTHHTHTDRHRHTHTDRHRHTHTDRHTHTHIQTHTHTHTHTDTHRDIYNTFWTQ